MLLSKTYFVLILIITIFLASSCDDKFKPAQTDLDSQYAPSQESWNSTVNFSDSGRTKAVLEAGHISVYTSKGYTLIDSGAKVNFYNAGEVASVLTGRRGKVDDKTKDIEIYDSVRVVNKEGSELKTQKLFWNNQTRRVSSDEFVSIKTPTETIEGVGFESDQNLKNYKIFKVSGTFSE